MSESTFTCTIYAISTAMPTASSAINTAAAASTIINRNTTATANNDKVGIQINLETL